VRARWGEVVALAVPVGFIFAVPLVWEWLRSLDVLHVGVGLRGRMWEWPSFRRFGSGVRPRALAGLWETPGPNLLALWILVVVVGSGLVRCGGARPIARVWSGYVSGLLVLMAWAVAVLAAHEAGWRLGDRWWVYDRGTGGFEFLVASVFAIGLFGWFVRRSCRCAPVWIGMRVVMWGVGLVAALVMLAFARWCAAAVLPWDFR